MVRKKQKLDHKVCNSVHLRMIEVYVILLFIQSLTSVIQKSKGLTEEVNKNPYFRQHLVICMCFFLDENYGQADIE